VPAKTFAATFEAVTQAGGRPMPPRATNDAGDLQSGDDWTLVPTVVERGASLGSSAIIMGGVRIGERALVGAARSTADVAAGETVVGSPARPISMPA
jgi:UDP-2-acetamido-3-amino-2,3-dideoxy-glucuronate N-acetyltransferase